MSTSSNKQQKKGNDGMGKAGKRKEMVKDWCGASIYVIIYICIYIYVYIYICNYIYIYVYIYICIYIYVYIYM